MGRPHHAKRSPGSWTAARPVPGDHGASLVELLVVLFIMGIMMGMLLPALNGARNRAQATFCENNVRQLGLALSRVAQGKKKFPAPGQWTFEILPYMEQMPLYQVMRHNREPNPKYPRPPLLRCPMQDEVPSRVDAVGASHYALVLDRLPNGDMERGWEIQDLPLPYDDSVPEPWYVAPEISYPLQQHYFTEKAGPHPPGMYATTGGLRGQ